jgi:hypothetical protein
MTSPLDNSLQRALSVRLNLQITLSSLPIVEEWMDIHLDRWLEHVPMPPEMPDGHQASYLVSIGSDLRRLWWGAWGHPRGFVPKMADYFKLCNIAKSDEAVIDELGAALEPALVGSWVGVWGGKVLTGWHFWDPHEWEKLEPMFGTHEAKFLLKKWVADSGISRFERFMQAIGEAAFSEVELALPGDTVDDQVAQASRAFEHFTGAPLDAAVIDVLRGAGSPGFALSLRIKGGHVARCAVAVPGLELAALAPLCAAARTGYEPNLERVINTLSAEGIDRVEYGRAGEHAGVDVLVEPTESAPRDAKPAAPAAVN